MSSAGEGGSGAEEGIMVAIRMRPLNSKEKGPDPSSKSRRVWKVLQKHSSITQCTAEGKPLPERIIGRSFFSYDKTFGESSTTRQVYDEVAKGIVGSVTNGLNGTIFAYGQTSSGKTFTMQGSGSLDSISHLNIDGGIVHMAASDIFQHIEASTDRVFLVRVSFIEIYNEEVRDLLVSGGDDNTLSVREDPRRGVFVNSNETIVTGLDSLLSVLFAGEKNRSVASTGMNERSSRSHTIFRITVESRLKSAEKNDTENEESDEEMEDVDDNEMSNGNGAVRVSTLNLVDLAGSESVRHTGATGDRQKEGGKINQSLLTLSRVIGSLGQNATHINFRDSKLTRILQPSLSGNARMAVICCATPSELYLEETRSTLQFASRAKLVKTRAQVNEVLDDRSLIKKLQRELKEARDAGNGTMDTEKMKALEEKAVTEAEAKRKAEHDLKRMKDLILKGGVLPMNISYDGDGKSSLFKSLFIYNDAEQTIKTGSNSFFLKEQKGNGKRRYSDGAIKCSSPVRDVTNKPERATFNSPKGDTITRVQAKTEIKPKKPKSASQISISALTEENDIDLLRQALAAKSSQTLDLKSKLSSSLDQTQALEQKLLRERGEKEMLRLAKQDLEFQVTALASDKEFVMTEQGIVCEEKNDEIGTYLSKIELMLIERKEQAQSVNELNALVESLQNQIESIKNDHASAVETLSQQRTNELAEVQSQFLALRNQMKTMETEHVSATQAMKEVHKAELKTLQDEHDEVVDEMKSEVDSLRSQIEHLRNSHDTEVAQHKSNAEEARLKVGATNDQIEQLKHEHFAEMEKLKEVHSAAMAQSQSEKDDVQSKLALQEETCQAQAAKILELESSVQEMQALLEKTKMEKEKAEENLTAVTREMEVSESRCANQADVIKNLESSVEELNQRLLAEDSTAQVLHSKVADLTNQNSELESEKTSLQMEIDEKAKSLEATTAKLQDAAEATAVLEELVEELKDSLSGCEAKLQKTETCLTSVTSELNTANSEKAALKEEIELLASAKESSDEQLERLNKAISENDSVNIQKLAELSASLQQTQDGLSAKTQEAESLRSELSEKEDTINELEEKLAVANNQCEAISADRAKLQVHADELANEVSTLKTAQSECQQSFTTQLEITKTEVLTLTETNAALSTTNDNLVTQLTKVTEDNDSLSSMVQDLTTKITGFEQQAKTVTSERDDALATLESLQSGSECTAETLKEMTSKNNSLAERIIEIQNERDNLQSSKGALEKSVETLKMRLEELEGEKEASFATLTELQSEKELVNEKIAELKSANEKSNEMIASLEVLKADLESTIDAKNQVITTLQTTQEALQASASESQDRVQQLSDTCDELKAEVTRLEASANDAEERANVMQVEREEALKKLADDVSQKETLIETLNTQISTATSERNEIEAQLNARTTELASLQNEMSIKESTITTLVAERDAADARTNELLKGDGESMAIVQSLQSEKAALVAKVEETIARLDNEKEDAQSTISSLTSSNTELQSRIKTLTDELSTAKSEIDELRTITEKSETDYKALLSEKEECLNELEDAIEQLNGAETRHAEEMAKLRQGGVESSPSDSAEEIASLKKEVDELKILLTSANDSVDEARDAALRADEELEAKEVQLEQALRDVAEAQEKVRYLQSAVGIDRANTESEEELLKEMEILMSEKADVESRLEAELAKRKEIEDEILRQADEEKHTLMIEAEEKMVMLRDEISQLRSDLSRVESELYTTKDETEDLRDQNLRAESKVRDTEQRFAAASKELDQERDAKALLQQKLDQLLEESNAFKSQAFAAKAVMEAEAQGNVQLVENKLSQALSEMANSQREIKHLNEIIEDLSSDIEGYKQQLCSMKEMECTENDIETSKMREELAKVKVELSTLKSDYLSAKNEVAAAKDKIAQVKAREHEKCLALAQKAKESIEQLQGRVKEAEGKAKTVGGSVEEVASLKSQVEDLTNTIKIKDARIQKLETSKMTKQQVERVKKMTIERSQYKEELEKCKQRVKELEQEVANSDDPKPRRKGLRERSADEDSGETARLQNELRQCNEKLRKYVNHSERLEKERNGAMAVISSANLDDIFGSNLEEMVNSLCERLASIEEECDALAGSEDKAARYLSELDSIREKYSGLETQLKFYKDSNDELSNSYADCKSSLNRAQEKIATLTKEIRSLQDSNVSTKGTMAELESEQRRQMQWLEKENLQLGGELKQVKKELIETKTMLNSLHKTSFGNDEATEDLFGLTNFTDSGPALESSSSKRKPLGTISKSQSSSVKKTAEKKRYLPAQESRDKENTTDLSRSPVPSSAKKQRKINPFSSVKKAGKKLTQALSDDSSPKHLRLGDAEENTAELTSDCKQS